MQPAWTTGFPASTSAIPRPANEARELSPAILSDLRSGFHVDAHRQFEIGITLAPEFYLDYVMTETNVAAAVRSGVPHSEIKSWCAETLAPVWNGARAGSPVPWIFRLYDRGLTPFTAPDS